MRLLLAAAVPCLLAACGSPTFRCDEPVGSAIQVVVYDELTGAPAADGARGWIQDGTYIDSLRVTHRTTEGAGLIMSAGDRAGSFDVFVQKSGYHDWSRSGVDVDVDVDDCAVNTFRLRADLRPLR